MVAPIGARANRLRNAHQAAHQPQCPVAQRLGSARLPSSGTAQLPARSHASGSAAPSRPSRHALAVSASAPAAPAPQKLQMPGKSVSQVNVVYKFGGSSVRDAERMREVADIICSFPHYLPCVVLSAMGKTTNMLLECGDLALQSTTENIPSMPPLQAIRKLHMDTCDQLQVEASCRQEVDRLLSELQQLLIGICIMQDLTLRAKDSLVSFGERLSTRIFASYLRVQGVNARQFDAPNLGVITTDDFSNAEINYERSLSTIKANLTLPEGGDKFVPIVTGFLGRGEKTGAITTLGRGGSDLTATVLGAALELSEVQVWKDVDGVLTADPRIVAGARPVTQLTFEEATELAYFGAQVLHPAAMQPAVRSGSMNVRVKNSYNRTAEGTVISAARDMSQSLVTSTVLKKNVTLVDIVSTRMLGQYGFLATVFEVFRKNRVSVDVVATSEVSISLTLDNKKINVDGDTTLEERMGRLVYEFEAAKVAQVTYRTGLSIISLICNVERTSTILQRAFSVLEAEGINVQMMSQGASKTNISLVVNDAEGDRAIKALHAQFFPAAAVAAANGNGNGKAH